MADAKGGFPAGRPEVHAAYLQTAGVNDLFERMLAAVLVEKPAARRTSEPCVYGGGVKCRCGVLANHLVSGGAQPAYWAPPPLLAAVWTCRV